MYRFLGESHEKVLTTIALSLSALVATSAMAAPQHHDPRYAPHKPLPHWDHKDAKNGMIAAMTVVITTVGLTCRDWRVGQNCQTSMTTVALKSVAMKHAVCRKQVKPAMVQNQW